MTKLLRLLIDNYVKSINTEKCHEHRSQKIKENEKIKVFGI